ncbi:MAG: PAS domain S-box protein [Bacteroidetes bacterium]|nr:MAG: PAS domain S-box protein [Bacteroidota bacterium]TAG87391.1 MAG: PAS domain S-box protein [Bacteroidota bacterium]
MATSQFNIFSLKSAFGRILGIYLILGLIVSIFSVYIYNQIQNLKQKSNELQEIPLLLHRHNQELESDLTYWSFLNYFYEKTQDKTALVRQKSLWEKKIIGKLDSLRKNESIANNQNLENSLINIKKDIIRFEETFDKKKTNSQTNDLVLAKIRKDIQNFDIEIQISIKQYFYQINKNIENVEFTLWVVLTLGGILSFIFTWLLFRNIFQKTNQYAENINTLINGNLPIILPNNTTELMPVYESVTELKASFTRLKAMAEEIGGGTFDASITMFAGRGEIGAALKGMRDSLGKISRDNWERNFFNEGFAKFSEILRNSNRQTSQGFYDSIINNLVRYLDVAQGGIFSIQEASTKLPAFMVLRSSYAYQRKKSLEKQLTYEDGVIGQVWRERDLVYINDIPENYSEITSGIGQAKPKSILVVPLISNDYLNGIIELSSFREFEPYQIEFVKRLSESISSTIARLQVDEESRRTTREAESLGEKMQAQEAQIRQTLATLEEAQKAMERKNIEMENQLKALEESFIYIEITPQGTIVFANDITQEVSGYNAEELLGLSFRMLLGKHSEDEKVNRDWQRILNGHQVKGEFLRYGKNGQRYWVQEVIYPLLNADGQIYKIVSIGYDITKQKQKEFEVKQELAELQMNKRDVVKRIKEVENKSKAKIQQMQQDFFVQIKEKERIIEGLKK